MNIFLPQKPLGVRIRTNSRTHPWCSSRAAIGRGLNEGQVSDECYVARPIVHALEGPVVAGVRVVDGTECITASLGAVATDRRWVVTYKYT